jgi:integrase
MSIYRRPGTKFYQYTIYVGGQKIQGSTKKVTEREAKAWEVDEIRRLQAQRLSGVVEEDIADMTFGRAVERYKAEVVSEWRNAKCRGSADVYLKLLQDRVGTGRLMRDLTRNLVQQIITLRCKDPVRGNERKASSVNFDTFKPLKAIYLRARDTWGVPGLKPINWKEGLRRKEDEERVRWVEDHEEHAVHTALPPAYELVMRLARATGLRKGEVLIRWIDIDDRLGVFKTVGKGRKTRLIDITPEVQEIFDLARIDNPTEFVFVSRKTKHSEPRPITYSGLTQMWWHTRKRGKLPADLRWHDLRHDYATKLLDGGADIADVQAALGHADVQTTMRYAHVRPARLRAIAEKHSARLVQLREEVLGKPEAPIQEGNLIPFLRPRKTTVVERREAISEQAVS